MSLLMASSTCIEEETNDDDKKYTHTHIPTQTYTMDKIIKGRKKGTMNCTKNIPNYILNHNPLSYKSTPTLTFTPYYLYQVSTDLY